MILYMYLKLLDHHSLLKIHVYNSRRSKLDWLTHDIAETSIDQGTGSKRARKIMSNQQTFLTTKLEEHKKDPKRSA